MSLSNQSIKIAITVFLQLIVVLSFQSGLNTTSAQKIGQLKNLPLVDNEASE
ncbi:MAG TPA: hypothetical protein VLD84_09720 [Nitrososphaeraceae archaeon]|nr:hypothetical protein [Nitrososphaeraceae archaeon]